jgi:hypothetical protein
MLFVIPAASQESTSLNRSEVAALKARIVAVQAAMGVEPDGYIREEEDSFDLPTDFNPASDGKFWPIVSSVQMRFTDRGAVEGAASIEQIQQEFMARYSAALASGNAQVIERMVAEMTQMQTAAAAAAFAPADRKEDMQIYIQLNMNPIVSIDPDAVVLEQSGVIVLREKDDAAGNVGAVTVYVDPVVLAATEELAKFELRTAQDGVTNRTGVFHIVIQINGALADIESWVTGFDYPAMLAVIDPR